MADLKKRVIVLGAGASCSYLDSPTRQRPPLANQIIPTFFQLSISENRSVLIGDIANYVRDTRGIKPEDFPTWTDDIELFFTEIDEKIKKTIPLLRGDKPNGPAILKALFLQRVYNQLIFLFASVFNEIQNGPVSIPYSLLANGLGENDTCITFNWDTLLDRALVSAGKWSPINGYEIRPESIFDDGWLSVDSFASTRGGPKYLKLHGSTNWLAPYSFVDVSTGKSRTLSGYAIEKLYIFLRATKPYKTYENRYWGQYVPYSYCYYPPNLPAQRDDVPTGYTGVRIVIAPDLGERVEPVIDDKNVYSMPLLIPPIRDKQYLSYGNIISSLWTKAKNALSECEELYIIGYSFPPTDQVSRILFESALKHNKSIKKIVIWNPKPDPIKELFIDIFGLDSRLIFVKREQFDPLRNPSSTILSY